MKVIASSFQKLFCFSRFSFDVEMHYTFPFNHVGMLPFEAVYIECMINMFVKSLFA